MKKPAGKKKKKAAKKSLLTRLFGDKKAKENGKTKKKTEARPKALTARATSPWPMLALLPPDRTK